MKQDENKMEMKDVYSPFKIMNWMYKIEQLKNGELPIPVFVQWDLTNACNLNCSFCFYRKACTEDGYKLSDWDANDIMPTEVVMRTLDELKDLGVKAIEWTGGGSIELHPDYKLIFKRAAELGFKQSLVTNGTLLDDEALQLIKNFEWIRFSIDAATPESWSNVKGANKDNWFKIMNNIGKLFLIKKPDNVIGFSFVICPDNYNEIHKAAILAKELCCDNIRFSIAMTPKRHELFKDIWDECIRQLELAKKEQTKNFRVFAFSNRINTLKMDTLSEYCGYMHFCGVIAPRGIYPCCRLKDLEEYNLGDLKTQTFKEIWFGKKRQEFMKSIKNGCPFDCWMYDKNAFVQYLMVNEAPHKEFV